MCKITTLGVLLALSFAFTVTGYAQEVDLSTLLKQRQALQTPVFVQLADQTYLLGIARAENEEQASEKPPLSKGTVASEILLGTVLGTVLGVVGGYGGALAGAGIGGVGQERVASEEDVIGGFYLGLLVGSIFGSATGVYIAGTSDDVTGSFLAALGGSIAGGCCMFFGGPIGAAIAFNKTRRYKSPPAESGTALINYRDGQMSLAVPRVYFRPDSFGRRSLRQRVDLLSVRF